MIEIIRKIKAEQKLLAVEIRDLKSRRKKERGGYVPRLLDKSKDYRYQHLVYCLLRGRSLEQIEPKTRTRDEGLLHRIWEHYLGQPFPIRKESSNAPAVRPCA